MSEQKIFAGPRIRRLRNGLGLTQSAMATELGISPSYLNLVERNQRPLTVQLLLKLGSTYDLNLEDLQGSGSGVVQELREVFADPLLVGELPGPEELIEVSDAAPNAANGILKLYRAYREAQNRLTDLKDVVAQEGALPNLTTKELPFTEMRNELEGRPNYFDHVDRAAEEFAKEIGHGTDLSARLKDWFLRTHRITVQTLPIETMPDWRRRFDKHTMRLFISERLSPFDQTQQLATEAIAVHLKDAIDEDMRRLILQSDEAKRLARLELTRYGALALMMPYMSFLRSAKRSNYSVAEIAARFSVSFEQASWRLTSLARQAATGLDFFMAEMDVAGHVVRRAGAKGFPRTEFGGQCPKLMLFEAFLQPSTVLSEPVELPNGNTYLTIARTADSPRADLHEPVRRTAIVLACPLDQAAMTVYYDPRKPKPVGPSCRLCERQACLSRGEPPITKPLAQQDMGQRLSIFDFQ